MELTDRGKRRMRVLLSVVVVCAVLATFSEVRKGIGWAWAAACGRNHSAMVTPGHQYRSSRVHPTMISNGRQLSVSGLMASSLPQLLH